MRFKNIIQTSFKNLSIFNIKTKRESQRIKTSALYNLLNKKLNRTFQLEFGSSSICKKYTKSASLYMFFYQDTHIYYALIYLNNALSNIRYKLTHDMFKILFKILFEYI